MNQIREVRQAIIQNIELVVAAGAAYADARYYADDSSETLVLYDGNLEANDTTVESGIGVRVLWSGAWGFAATSDTVDVRACFDQALQNAQTAAQLIRVPLGMGRQTGHIGSYASPVEVDPFAVSLPDKLEFLQAIDDRLVADWILKRLVYANLQRKHILFFNSDGTEIEKHLTNSFGRRGRVAGAIRGSCRRA